MVKHSEKLMLKEASANGFEDFFPKEKAKTLEFRSNLMVILIAYIQKTGMTQKEAAKFFGVSQPRISNLVHCDIDKFSNGALLDMLEIAGFNVYENLEKNLKQTIGDEYWIIPATHKNEGNAAGFLNSERHS